MLVPPSVDKSLVDHMRQTRESLQDNPLYKTNDDNVSVFSSWSCSSSLCCEAGNEVIFAERSSEFNSERGYQGFKKPSPKVKSKKT